MPHIWSPLGERTCQQKPADQKCRKQRGSSSFYHTKHSFTLIHITFVSAQSCGVFHKEKPQERLYHLDPKVKVTGQETEHAALVAMDSVRLL